MRRYLFIILPVLLLAAACLLLIILKSSHRENRPILNPLAQPSSPSEEAADQAPAVKAPSGSPSSTLARRIHDPLLPPGDRLRLIRQAGIQKSSDAVDPLILALQDDNALFRGEAAEALGHIGDKRALQPLLAALDDPDPTVRTRVVLGLGLLARAEAVPKLITALYANRNRPDGYGPAICREIVRALAATHDHAAVDPLIAEMARQEDLSYKNEVVRALGIIGDPKAADTLHAHLDWLQTHRPAEKIALFPWQQAVDTTNEALHRLDAGTPRPK